MEITKEKKINIGFYGERGSFSEEGALCCIGNFSLAKNNEINLIPCGKGIEDVFSKVVNKELDFGVVPVENSTSGIINVTYDLLLNEKIYVVGEGINRIGQHLMVNKDVAFDQIEHIYSHKAAIYQCKKFLRTGNWVMHTGFDTASAVRKVKEENLSGKIDLVISDIVMPEMGGEELAQNLRELNPNVKILLCSGFTDSRIIQKDIQKKNGYYFLPKPYSIKKLEKTIQEIIHQPLESS